MEDHNEADKSAEESSVSPEDMEGENTPPEVEPQSETVVQNDKYAQELPITHLKSPENNRVFAATPDLMSRKDLIPCDEHGKKVYDHRCL